MPFVYKHPEYWQKIAKASKEHGDSTYSKDVFDDSEAAGLLKEEHFIPVENIGGKLVLVGAEDDSLWDTAKYIRRMDNRLKSRRIPANTRCISMNTAHILYFPKAY